MFTQSFICVRLFETLWTVARQAPLSMRFFRQEYWNGLLFPSPGNLPDPGIEPMSSALAGRFFTTEPQGSCIQHLKKWNYLVSRRSGVQTRVIYPRPRKMKALFPAICSGVSTLVLSPSPPDIHTQWCSGDKCEAMWCPPAMLKMLFYFFKCASVKEGTSVLSPLLWKLLSFLSALIF